MRVEIPSIKLDPTEGEGKAEVVKTREVFERHLERAAVAARDELGAQRIHITGVQLNTEQ
jgi:hypothetical protein